MKKKGARSIPDFSKKRPAAPGTPQPTDAGGPARNRPQPVKPQGTTSKSGGRRGS